MRDSNKTHPLPCSFVAAENSGVCYPTYYSRTRVTSQPSYDIASVVSLRAEIIWSAERWREYNTSCQYLSNETSFGLTRADALATIMRKTAGDH